jgi:hypothetical protein
MTFLLAAAVVAALGVSVAGCGGDEAAKKDAGGGDAHDHPSEGPHDGVLVELGDDEYHAEVCHDDATHKVTVYLLDSKAKNAVAVAEKDIMVNLLVDGKPAQFVLPAAPLDGEMDGKSSRFELADEQLCEGFDADGAEARLKLTIGGTPFEGKIPAHDHDKDHDHHQGHDDDRDT